MARNEEIDAAVRASLTVHWQKVAMVAAKAMDQLNVRITDGDTFDQVCARVELLVQRGEIAARGDVSVPTQSEVRLGAPA
jgi:hypothetical protein